MTTRSKPVVGTFAAGSSHVVGDGFPVRNLFPSNDLGERLSPTAWAGLALVIVGVFAMTLPEQRAKGA